MVHAELFGILPGFDVLLLTYIRTLIYKSSFGEVLVCSELVYMEPQIH